MSILSWITGRDKAPRVRVSDQQGRRRAVPLRATYDAAQTTTGNTRHWAASDSCSADEANSYSVRKKLRERSRYEVANNSYARGIINDHARDIVGQKGPRLQLLTEDNDLNKAVEREWFKWATAIHLGRKLRTLQEARVVDGEGFAQLRTNTGLGHPVTLDLQVFDCDRVHDTTVSFNNKNIDGVILNDELDSVDYWVLKSHPGDYDSTGEHDVIPGEYIIHWFRHDRPEQHRGIPEITPALPLFAMLRRYSLAVLTTAEFAATITGVLETDSPPAAGEEEVDTFDAFEIERNSIFVSPYQWKIHQLEAQQPTSSHKDFMRQTLNEIARCLTMPLNIAMADSSGYNFASGRLDHGTYYKSIEVYQGDLGDEVVERIFAAWLEEACRVLPDFRNVSADVDHSWLWQGREPIDPREAKAETERLGSGAVTIPMIYARRGQDHQPELEKGAEALGVSLEEYRALIRGKVFGLPIVDELEEDVDDEND